MYTLFHNKMVQNLLLPMLLPLPLAAIVGLALAFALAHFLFGTKHAKRQLPPGSMGWPLLGETLDFLRPHQSNSIGCFLQDHCTRYGKVFKSNLFGCPTIVSCDYELNMFVLQNENKLFQCSYPKAIHQILGHQSLLVVSGDVHKRLRSFIVNFSTTCKARVEYLHDIENLAVFTMKSWKTGEQVLFSKDAKKFTFNLIVKQILSMQPGQSLSSMILEDFLTFMKGLVSLPLNIPGTSFARALKARGRICATIRLVMKERRTVRTEKNDFLDVLLSVEELDDEERVSLVLDLLLGGYETTSILISMAVYFLSHSPRSLEKLKREHQEIKLGKKEEYLSWEDYNKMAFTQNVITETLRCGNVVKFVHRKALQDVVFKGYLIPSGWKVLPLLSPVHLDPSLHERASEFDPSRWDNQASNKNMAPFGGGTKQCPGAELGKVETAFFLHHLVLNYRWVTNGVDDHPLAYPYVEFQRGMPVNFEPIQPSLKNN